jgi:tRNA threonylcarbamoyladenosine biosynthesis protein TsaB
MNFVAFETSTETVSVALHANGVLTTESVTDAGVRSGELALPIMHRLLRDAGLRVADIDVVVFGQGPGAFTGVRVACAVAQGLAVGLGKPIIALPSHVALAETAAPDVTQVLVACDARMGEVYWSLWKRVAGDADSRHPSSITTAAGWHIQVAPRLSRPDAVASQLDNLVADSKIEGVGSAFAIPALGDPISNVITAVRGRALDKTRAAHPEAGPLICVAVRAYEAIGEAATCAPENAMPLYVRDKVALTIAERAAERTAQLATAAPAIAEVR